MAEAGSFFPDTCCSVFVYDPVAAAYALPAKAAGSYSCTATALVTGKFIAFYSGYTDGTCYYFSDYSTGPSAT